MRAEDALQAEVTASGSAVMLTLPVPPSANNLFYNTRNDGRRPRMKTKTYRVWIKEAGWLLALQRPRPVIGPVAICLDLPATLRGDIANREKASLDLLVRMKIIEGDSRKIVKRLQITSNREVPDMLITISPEGWK